MLSNKKGFSLIELMVVVAIIAILSTIAIPSYQNFQAKARQKEGFGLLSGYYTSAQATAAEHGFYPGDFISTGYQPTGQLGYRVTAGANNPSLAARVAANQYYGTYSTNCNVTTDACTCLPTACTVAYTVWDEVVPAGSGVGAAAPVDGGACAGVVATDTQFRVRASGIIRTGGVADTYEMNERKELVMCNDGLRQ